MFCATNTLNTATTGIQEGVRRRAGKCKKAVLSVKSLHRWFLCPCCSDLRHCTVFNNFTMILTE